MREVINYKPGVFTKCCRILAFARRPRLSTISFFFSVACLRSLSSRRFPPADGPHEGKCPQCKTVTSPPMFSSALDYCSDSYWIMYYIEEPLFCVPLEAKWWKLRMQTHVKRKRPVNELICNHRQLHLAKPTFFFSTSKEMVLP